MKIPPGVFSDALFSPCGKYRYWLTRTWDLSRPTVAVIGLNPSKASLERDDNTVRKCYEFVRKRDYGRLLMLNLYAYVATDPDDMWHAHKTGIDITGGVWNSFTALQAYRKAFHVDNTVAAWGREAGARSDDAGRQLQNMLCFGTNKDGTPKHPCRIPYSEKLRPWNFQ
jgi:hypothetical protein